MSGRRPDFFLVGAPKCGTTAMSEYLREHPDVCFSRPKEPYHFCTDLPGFHRGWSDREYLERCFGHCRRDHEAVGEGSVFYLFSREAVPRILEFEPRARFLVHVRNPVDVAYSFHGQLLWNYSEDEEDFRTAWRLQRARRQERRIPSHCREPRLLQYREVAALGSQLDRLLSHAGRERVHVVVFDDLAEDAGSAYRGVLSFLGLPDDGRDDFPRVNPSEAHRSRLVARLVQRPSRRVLAWWETVKDALGLERTGILPWLRRVNARRRRRPPLDPTFREELVEAFEPEIDRLEELCGRDLSAWREVSSADGPPSGRVGG